MMIVLPNRKCGKAKGGGLYSVGEPRLGGTLLPFTALVAATPAEISNPRAAEQVSIPRTLGNKLGVGGLWPPGDSEPRRWKGIKAIGLADLWGKSQGYKDVWDAIKETDRKGICRRIAKVPSLQPPIPILMLHMEAAIHSDLPTNWALVEDFLLERECNFSFSASHGDKEYLLWSQPFLDSPGLGRVGNDDYMWHPAVSFYQGMSKLRKQRQRSKFLREFGIHFAQGVFGLAWITKYVYCLRENEGVVPRELAEQGVVAGIAEDDPRAASL